MFQRINIMNHLNRFGVLCAVGLVTFWAGGASATEAVAVVTDNTVPIPVHILLAGTAVVLAAQYAGRVTWRRLRSGKIAS